MPRVRANRPLDDLFVATPTDTTSVVQVLVPVALDDSYSYRVPAGMTVGPGSIVQVPLGPRKIVGVVTAEPAQLSANSNRLRPIERAFDVPPLPSTLMALIDWVARYTLTPRGLVMRMAVRAPEALDPEPPLTGLVAGGPAPERLTGARKRVLELVAENGGMAWTKAGLASAAGVSVSVIDGLVTAGSLTPVDMPAGRPFRRPEPDFNPIELTAEQQAAVAALAGGEAGVTLLDGVTGSGKTEVYFEAVAEALRAGRQALILVPEIALTRAFLERFSARFGALPAEWHSDLTPRQRARAWRAVATGEARVVVGARSALFLPFAELGLIVVDEEHDGAYKQEEWASYHARDMAVVRGRLEGCPVILASATPSLESRVNVERGRYRHVALTARASGTELPRLYAIDMRKAGPPRGRFLAPGLVAAIAETTGRGEQALLFLNRRGYAPLTLCRSCGHRFQCPNCSSWLVEHRFRGRLVCHHCGHSVPRPEACPSCGSLDSLTACGPGVERIAEEIQTLLPERRTVVLSSDMGGGIHRLKAEFEAVARGECDIVVGTQMVAKGHNFPKLTLVGVVDADLGLAQGDPRAAERTFQLLGQVTGRAGRAFGNGIGLMQTFNPDSPVIAALISGDAERFYATELAERRAAAMPPFGRLAAVVVSAPTREEAEDWARGLARAAPPEPAVAVLGPAEAPLAVIKGRHRFRLLAHSARDFDLSAYMRLWMQASARPPAKVDVWVDIDPYGFL